MNYRRLRHALRLLLLVCCVLNFSSCSEDLDNPSLFLYRGTWTVVEAKVTDSSPHFLMDGDKLILHKNSKFEIKNKSLKYEGKWSGTDENILFSVKDENGEVDDVPDIIGFVDKLTQDSLKVGLRFGPAVVGDISIVTLKK